eukprot:scaffold103646_cov57-Phaeocystis_antarctica.AAC.2
MGAWGWGRRARYSSSPKSRVVLGLERVLAHVTRAHIHPTREAPLLRVWRRWQVSVRVRE